ncbi:MAG: hypothetical protein E6G36_02955 [Actinobacteria bacterium]|nr:MAG: hypothetical protein E6G36_02955 [Actinomycetota bacterium]
MRESQHAVRPGSGPTERDYVEFWPAGTMAKGRFRCTACGNAIAVRTVLPRCMLCGERLWEREESSPYGEVT